MPRSTPSPTTLPSTGSIRIFVGRQHDGCIYELHPLSQDRILALHPEARLPSKVFIGFDTQASFEESQGPLWEQIATLLTGLTREQLQALGGVELYDPATDTHRPVLALAS